MNTPINTASLQAFIQQVKAADQAKLKEIRVDMTSAKNMAYTLNILMLRLAGDYETLLLKKDKEDPIQIQMDGGKL